MFLSISVIVWSCFSFVFFALCILIVFEGLVAIATYLWLSFPPFLHSNNHNVPRATLLSFQSGRIAHARRESCLKPSLFIQTVLPVSGGQMHSILGIFKSLNYTVERKTSAAAVSFASKSTLTCKVVVIHLHFHWLPGPKCRPTQLTEPLPPIKWSVRAFK